ncbi:MAG: DUF4097 family beta strand repeat protein [Acidobacteria bacterium]|nr:DUF4097 family beta strand repeat protein [Acidobacteriota bacterium]
MSQAGNKSQRSASISVVKNGGEFFAPNQRKPKKSWLPFIGVMLVLAGVVFFAATAGMAAAKFLLGLWPLFAILAGVAGVMGFAVERKPKSPVGAMLLLFIGVLFSAGRFQGNLNALQIYGRYWIILLFVFAAVELIRYYSHRLTEGPAPRMLSFGKLLMVLLIVSTGIFANRLAVNNPNALASLRLPAFLIPVRDSLIGEKYSFTDEAVALPSFKPNATLSVNNSYGNITVSGDAPVARAYLVKEVSAWKQDDAQNAAKKINLVITPMADGSLAITTNRDAVNEEIHHEFNTHIYIEVPADLGLAITNSYGTVTANQIQGEVAITSSYGRVEAANIQGNATFNLKYSDVSGAHIKGNVTINGAKGVKLSAIEGAATVNAKNCPIEMRQMSGNVKIESSYARINLQDLQQRAIIKTAHDNIKINNAADVAIDAPHTNVTATNLRGTLQIDSSNSTIRANNVTGDLLVQATHTNVLADEVLGNVKVKTTHGDVSIKNFHQGVEVETNYDDVILATATPINDDIEVSNDKGSIKVTLPSSSNFHLDAQSLQGRVKTRGFDSLWPSDGERLNAVIGASGALLKLRTSYSEILVQASEARQTQSSGAVKAPSSYNQN